MNFFPQYLLFPCLSLFIIGGEGEGGGVVSASASLKEKQQQQPQPRLRRGLLQQQNNNNFDNNANERSRQRFSVKLEHDIEQPLERQPRIIGGSVVNNPGTRYPYFALMSGSALQELLPLRSSWSVNGNRRSRTGALVPLQSECSGRYQDTYPLLEKHWTEAQQCSWSR
mmetsp:Transcript_7636/g.7519  ORF Transcript_7636/g.7519 Transcript_7636/m.7519 type:complete len:169 (-) Transcript_7636:242-748(-)